jgi:hypothetical protein
MCNLKERLTAIGKSQVWLLKELRENGIETQPPQLSNIINGIYTYPKAREVLEKCSEIIACAEAKSGTNETVRT